MDCIFCVVHTYVCDDYFVNVLWVGGGGVALDPAAAVSIENRWVVGEDMAICDIDFFKWLVLNGWKARNKNWSYVSISGPPNRVAGSFNVTHRPLGYFLWLAHNSVLRTINGVPNKCKFALPLHIQQRWQVWWGIIPGCSVNSCRFSEFSTMFFGGVIWNIKAMI